MKAENVLQIVGNVARVVPLIGELIVQVNRDMNLFGSSEKVQVRATFLRCEITFLEEPTAEKLEDLRQRIERDAREAQPDWDLRVILDEKLPGA